MAPLAKLLLQGHGAAKLTRAERDLLMAWIDSNGLDHGTWDSTTNGCAHAVKPVEAFARRTFGPPDRSGAPVVGIPSTKSEDCQSLLAIIRRGRQLALAEPRVDMPGAKIVPGESRQLIALTLPERLPTLRATATLAGVLLSWDRRADIGGLTFELHRRDKAGFTPDTTTR